VGTQWPKRRSCGCGTPRVAGKHPWASGSKRTAQQAGHIGCKAIRSDVNPLVPRGPVHICPPAFAGTTKLTKQSSLGPSSKGRSGLRGAASSPASVSSDPRRYSSVISEDQLRIVIGRRGRDPCRKFLHARRDFGLGAARTPESAIHVSASVLKPSSQRLRNQSGAIPPPSQATRACSTARFRGSGRRGESFCCGNRVDLLAVSGRSKVPAKRLQGRTADGSQAIDESRARLRSAETCHS